MLPPQAIISRRILAAMLGAIFAGAAVLPAAHAIAINGEGPNGVTGIYDRFVVGTYPAAPVANPTFIGADFDLSGIGWLAQDASRSFTLISPSYLLAATHFLPNVGNTIRFRGTDGLLYSSTVQSLQALIYDGSGGPQNSDVTLVRLNTPLPAAVTPMPIVYLGTTDSSDFSTFSNYIGLPLFNYGHTARMGTNVSDSFDEFSLVQNGPAIGVAMIFDRDAGAGETLFEGFDSGSPTLALVNGQLGLVGIHTGVDPGPQENYDSFVSYTPFIDAMSSALLPFGETLVLVPEPGGIGFGLVGLAMCGARRRRSAVWRA